MVEPRKWLLSSSICSGPWHAYNFHRPSTSRSTELTKALEIPLPQRPQRERIRSNYVNHLSRTCAYSSYQVLFLTLPSKRFPRFLSPPPPTPYVSGSYSNWKWSNWNILSFYISSYIKIRSPIPKIKIPQFSSFPRFPVSPSNSPNVTGSGRDLK